MVILKNQALEECMEIERSVGVQEGSGLPRCPLESRENVAGMLWASRGGTMENLKNVVAGGKKIRQERCRSVGDHMKPYSFRQKWCPE